MSWPLDPVLAKTGAGSWGANGAGAKGIGPCAAWVMVRVVTVAGAAAQAVRRVVRRTTRRCPAAATVVLPLVL
jgi:hypothetical protein